MSKKKEGPVLYKIHNTVRDVQTRVVRAVSPTRHCRVLLLGGGLIRVVRKRPAIVALPILKRLVPELIELEKVGRAKVTDMAGRRLNLETGELAELPPAPKPPTKVLDSAANDPAFEHGVGQDMPTMQGNEAEQAEVEPPAILERDFPEGEDEVVPGTSYGVPEDEAEPAPVPEEIVPEPAPEGVTPEEVVPEEPVPEEVVPEEPVPEVADTEPAPEPEAEPEVPAVMREKASGRRRKRGNKKG
jgi:hypothetical protein